LAMAGFDSDQLVLPIHRPIQTHAGRCLPFERRFLMEKTAQAARGRPKKSLRFCLLFLPGLTAKRVLE